MNPRHLEFIIAVAEHRSFTRAAEEKHISQPALSRAIGDIEKQVGAVLFHRAGRTVLLTPAGEAFVESARIVLRDLSVLHASVRSLSELRAGTLDVAAPHASAADLLARLLGIFCERHPGVRVRIQTSENPHDLERYVRTGRAEIGFTVERVETGLMSEVVDTEENMVVFPPRTKLKRQPVKPVDLAGLRMVVPTGAYQYYGMFQLPPREAPVIAVETESRQALVPLVLAGAGFTFLPEALAKGAARQGAVCALLDPPLRRDIWLVTPPGPLSPPAQVFANIARSNASHAASKGKRRR